MRFLVYCSFVGTNYIGWQNQPNGTSVQASLEAALSIFFNFNTSIVGCGRTDSGVHGRNYAFHFDTKEPI
jgi:tRNA pseudouridine38-40 synthase